MGDDIVKKACINEYNDYKPPKGDETMRFDFSVEARWDFDITVELNNGKIFSIWASDFGGIAVKKDH